MDKLDKLLESRATQEKSIQDLLTQEDTLRQSVKELNEALDIQNTELSQLSATVLEKRNEMLSRVQEKRSRLEDMGEFKFSVEKEERRASSYRLIANESRYLRRRISRDCDEKKALEETKADFQAKREDLLIKCKNIIHEERTLWKIISEKVQWMAENGHPLVETGNEVSIKSPRFGFWKQAEIIIIMLNK